MLHLCVAIVASLCVPTKYAAVSQFSSMYTRVDADGHPMKDSFDPAEVKRTGIAIHTWDSDSIRTVSPLGLDRICAKGWCVYYRKHCDEAALTCTYAYSEPTPAHTADEWERGLAIYQGAEIHAPSKSEMTKLLGEIVFVIHFKNESDIVSVSLSALDQESADVTHFRGCMRSIWVQGCPKPELPQFRNRERP